ncbi:MAG: ribose 5-phosphate isomerase B [Candidatus Gastranaerophilales bacterium]|nr:ribose 5-phosphate isomerase B [Candidatus Gastranaerophilales bacterium]
MKIAIASDHGGYNLKNIIYNHLVSNGYEVVDFGTDSLKSCDYPIYAKKVCNAILNTEFDKGILVCGTGIGMSICANRFKGIRAACVSDTFSAKMTRAHNNSNVLCLGERVVGQGLALEILKAWLNTEYEAGRHQKRLDLIEE